MRRLTFIHEGEQGAIAMIVAMLFGFGVMISLAALTVDVGNINADRRQLQNGADAAVLSAASDCAKGACPSPGDAGLANLADKNAADGATKISRVDNVGPAVCGSGPNLADCPLVAAPNTRNLQECPAASALPAGAQGYVRVYTQTLDATRTKTLLPYLFGAAITGAGSGANQQTCAAAAWGNARVTPLTPFTFSACEWYHDTLQDNDPLKTNPPYGYAPYTLSTLSPPQSDPRNNPWEHAINLNSGTDPGCTNWQNHDFPGGFGWLDYDPATCKVADPVPAYTAGVVDGYWYPGDTGVGAGNQCGAKIEAAVGSVIYLPIFDCADNDTRTWPCAGNLPNGTNAWYHMKGAVAFFLTGVEITGQLTKDFDNSINGSSTNYPGHNASAECRTNAGEKKCLFGWFLEGLQDPTAVIDGSAFDTGLKAFQMIG